MVNNSELKLYGTKIKNFRSFDEKTGENLRKMLEYRKTGLDYIINPNDGKLHRVSLLTFFGSHNLENANLEDFIGIINFGDIPIHSCDDGTKIPIYDIVTQEYIDDYFVNKCEYCLPPKRV